jgi:hypothetical protein
VRSAAKNSLPGRSDLEDAERKNSPDADLDAYPANTPSAPSGADVIQSLA